MERRQYIKTTGAAVTGSLLAGCAASGSTDAADEDDATDDGEGSGSGESGTGTLATSVTDQPIDIDDFESCVITIDGIRVKLVNGEADEATDPDGDDRDEASTDTQGTEEADAGTGSGTEDDGDDLEDEAEGDGPNERVEDAAGAEAEGRRYVEFDKPQEADLVRLQGANTQLIDETELPVGEYRYLQLEVSGVVGVLAEGDEAEVDVPGNAPLQFKERFEIRPNERTRFVADFAPVRRGQGARYLLRPIATRTRVLYGDEEYDPSTGGENGRDADTDENDAGDANDEDVDGREADGNRPDADEGSNVPDGS